MEEKDRSFYDKFKDVVNAYIFHDPNAQAATAFDRERRKNDVDEKTLSMFRESAEAGHPFACFSLGRFYENGTGVEKDLEKAYEWYRKAAAGGDVNAWLALGKFFDTGTYVDKNPKEAAMWLERAAEKGHPIAMIGLGQKCVKGEGVEKDPKRALELFTKAYEQDKRFGSYILGEAIGDGIGCKKDYARAVELFKESHENHFALGTFNYGMMLEMGLGCEKDEEKGFELIKQAADEGIPDAMYRIAFHYREGTSGAKKDPERSFYYFKQAADKGFPLACVETGLCYENGFGTKVDKEEAFRYYEKGAQAGQHAAIVCLAVCYRSGIGCNIDRDKSISLLETAVRIGNTRAYHLLALALFEENAYDERAINLEMIAANAGFARSALFLGGFFMRGGEEGPDIKKSEYYYSLAAKEGDMNAKFELADLLDTEENRENEEVQKKIRVLYEESAYAGHPLAAYKMAQAYKEGNGVEKSVQKEVHFMSIASAGGVPAAAHEIADRLFWGDEMQVDLASACGLYRYVAEELSNTSLKARYAFCQVILSLEYTYREIGMYDPAYQKSIETNRKKAVGENEKWKEGMQILSELASEKVPDAMIFLPLARAISEGEKMDCDSEENQKLLSYIDSLPESRDKYYVQGLLSAILKPEDIQGSIQFLRYARANLRAANVDRILANLYYSLSKRKKKDRKGEILVLHRDLTSSWNDPVKTEGERERIKDARRFARADTLWSEKTTWKKTEKPTKRELLLTASEFYLEAYRMGQTKDLNMYCYCNEQLMRTNFILMAPRILGVCILLLPLLTLLILLTRDAMNGTSSFLSNFWPTLRIVATWSLPVIMLLIVGLEVITEVNLYNTRKYLCASKGKGEEKSK